MTRDLIFVTRLARHAFAVADTSRADRTVDMASNAELVDVAGHPSRARRCRPLNAAAGAVAGAILAQHPAQAAGLRVTQQPHAPTAAKVEDVGAYLQGSRHG